MKKSLLGIFMLSAMLGMCGFSAECQAKEETVLNGIYAGTIDLSGCSEAEAREAIQDYVEEQKEEKFIFSVKDETVEVSLGDLGFTWANEDVVEEALAYGKRGNPIKRYKEKKDLQFRDQVYALSYSADEEQILAAVQKSESTFNREAQDMGLKRENGQFVIVEGKEGIVVSEEKSVDAVLEYIESSYGIGKNQVELIVEVDLPKGDREQLSKVQDVLGSFTTSYSSSGANRSQNVRNGASLINGTVVYPGEEFSTYEYVSPFTEANGYKNAGSYLNGKVVDSLGGGICQVSSTLYNAVLLSELEVVERAPHSMQVSYVQPSADAAISGTYKDFKFKNNTDAPIYIEGTTTDSKKITFTIYGQETRPKNRTIEYTHKILSSTPAATVLAADGSQGIGYRSVESGHNGCVAELYKNVYIDGKLESSEKVNKSSYMVSNRTVTYGIVGDPNQSAQLQACIAAGDEAGANAVIGR